MQPARQCRSLPVIARYPKVSVKFSDFKTHLLRPTSSGRLNDRNADPVHPKMNNGNHHHDDVAVSVHG